jgi:hypothetical protein
MTMGSRLQAASNQKKSRHPSILATGRLMPETPVFPAQKHSRKATFSGVRRGRDLVFTRTYKLAGEGGESGSGVRPLGINGPKNNDKKMKWLVEPIGILFLYDVLLEEEREAHLIRFSSICL